MRRPYAARMPTDAPLVVSVSHAPEDQALLLPLGDGRYRLYVPGPWVDLSAEAADKLARAMLFDGK